MEKLQFRVLYREFLFRMVDLELLSSHALGDSNKLLGQFAALLIFLSVLLSMLSLSVGDSRTPPALRLFQAWSSEHFLIATTMLVVGIFGVLNWDSIFPDRRDVYLLAPLPVRPRTLFLAKVAASATALSLTVALLHSLAGLAWPGALGSLGTLDLRMPALGYLPAVPPAGAAGLEPLLRRDLAPSLSPEMGVAVGVLKNGESRLYYYGAARPDSIYQIASISKTFTGLVLAQMVEEGTVRLDQPLRELLPAGTASSRGGAEISLLDLAIHRSGLPTMPSNLSGNQQPNPDADYRTEDLYAFIARRGVGRSTYPPFVYSNAGYALLGQVLADHEGLTYPAMIARRITLPLGMRDTAIELSSEQMRRVIPAYSVRHELRPPWEIGALAPAGGINSTAADMLTYLAAQLDGRLPAARFSQELQGDLAPGIRIALAWAFDEHTGTYWHNGAISAYTSHALFNRSQGYAVVVLVNQAISLVTFADLVAQHVQQRLRGEPAVSLASVTVPSSGGLSGVLRIFGAYWVTMLSAGIFMFCALLILQGLAEQLLPRRVFLRASSYLQLAAFCGMLCVYLMQPLLAGAPSLTAASGDGLLAWSPSYWFLGLLQHLNGSPALGTLAHRACLALPMAIASAAALYSLSYFRTLRRIAEEPDIVSGTRGGVRLPRFGNPLQTAVVQFSVRTLLRSRLHRLIFAFYLGIGAAFMILLVKTPAAQRQLQDVPVADPWGQVNAPLLAATIAIMGFAIIGARVVFSLPLDLRANWIFRVTGRRTPAECLTASRRALLFLSLAPVWCAAAAVCVWLWPWRPALGHLAILAGLGLTLSEVCLHGFQKIPFTCSYLPGKSQVHLSVLGALGLLWYLAFSVRYERQVLESTGRTFLVVLALALLAAGARWRTWLEAQSASGESQFEDASDPAVLELGLTPK